MKASQKLIALCIAMSGIAAIVLGSAQIVAASRQLGVSPGALLAYGIALAIFAALWKFHKAVTKPIFDPLARDIVHAIQKNLGIIK